MSWLAFIEMAHGAHQSLRLMGATSPKNLTDLMPLLLNLSFTVRVLIADKAAQIKVFFVAPAYLNGTISAMSYKTVEVELENGRVHPAGTETLPDRTHALLTILSPTPAKSLEPAKSLGKAMRDLKVMGRGEFTDLSTNPRHMDDFGK
jgi:hypothetical protein